MSSRRTKQGGGELPTGHLHRPKHEQPHVATEMLSSDAEAANWLAHRLRHPYRRSVLKVPGVRKQV